MSIDIQSDLTNVERAREINGDYLQAEREAAYSGGARYGKTERKTTDEEDDRTTDPQCQNCGEFVTRDFARVFGNNLNHVFGCLECMTATDVKKGGARAEDVDTTNVSGGAVNGSH